MHEGVALHVSSIDVNLRKDQVIGEVLNGIYFFEWIGLHYGDEEVELWASSLKVELLGVDAQLNQLLLVLVVYVDFGVSSDGPMKSVSSLVVDCIDLDLLIQEQRKNLHVSLFADQNQESLTILVSGLQIQFLHIEEKSNYFGGGVDQEMNWVVSFLV